MDRGWTYDFHIKHEPNHTSCLISLLYKYTIRAYIYTVI